MGAAMEPATTSPQHSAILKKKILIVEDEKELAKLIYFHMEIAGYEALSSYNGVEALEAAKHHKPDLIILDIMLPRIDGWEVCAHLKRDPQTQNIPIIILSALAEINDKLKGFDLGADDYVTKPFSPRELVVRVKRVLGRAESKFALPQYIRLGTVEINREEMIVKRSGQEVLLTEKEKKILQCFIEKPGIILSHSDLMDCAWGTDTVVEYGNIDVHISHLREKIEKDPKNPLHIITIKGRGFKFEA